MLMQADMMDIQYLRLSKEDGDVEAGSAEESCSIASQRLCLQRYIQEHFGPEAQFEEYVDDGFSGTNMERPGIQAVLDLVKMGRVRTIIVRDLSRFARNYLEAGHYLEFIFPLYGVRFISVNDGFDTAILGEDTGGLELAIRNLINEMYSKDISRKIKSVVDMKKRNGEFVYGTAPYGYKKGEKKNTIVVDLPAAKVVKMIFEMAAGGTTVTQIANELNRLEITTPSEYLAPVRGKYKIRKVWSYESVRNILMNRIYSGDTEIFKSHVVKVGSDLVKPIPPELREVIPCTHEAIISRELFFQAHLTVKSTRKSKPSAPKNPLTSLLVCGCCGNRLNKGKAQNKDWLCSTRRYQNKLGCAEIRINDQAMRDILLRAIQMQCTLVDAKIRTMKRAQHNLLDEQGVLETELRQCSSELACFDSEKMRLYEEYASGEIDKDEYLVQKAVLVQDEETLKARCQTIQEKLTGVLKKEKHTRKSIEGAMSVIQLHEITELTSQLAKSMVQSITVYPNNRIQIRWNFNSAYLGKASEEIIL